MKTEERFWAKVEKTETCWNWTGGHNGAGYGRFWNGEKLVYSHRFSYALTAELPSDLEIDHLCKNHRCVNPSHLEAVTGAVNISRADYSRNGDIQRSATHCPLGHEYTPENTARKPNRSGGVSRHCRQCNREDCLKRYHRRRNKED